MNKVELGKTAHWKAKREDNQCILIRIFTVGGRGVWKYMTVLPLLKGGAQLEGLPMGLM